MTNIIADLENMREHYNTGITRSYEFRRHQLQAIKKAILKYETEIHEALLNDLNKSAEESWVTETGFVLSEINHTLKNLHKWIKSERVKTNLLNFPSKSYIYREPLGVVLVIGPWNYPLQLLLTPLIGAIAAGNTAVIKPSEFAPATARIINKLISEIFPTNYVKVIEGNGAEVVPALLNNFRFDHVFFTGSPGIGTMVYEMAAKKLVPVTLELGGKSPCIVDSEANLEVAARRIALATFSNAGQMCVAPDYILVHHSVKEKFISLLKDAIRSFFTEDPSSSYNYGKIINERQFNRLKGYLQHGNILYGGKYETEKMYIEPTLLDGVSLESQVMKDEIFGPILPLVSYTSFKEALDIINLNPHPLAFYVFTENKETANKWLLEVPFGGGCVNNASWHLTNFNLPFGGRGNSGIGSYHGRFSFDVFSHKKAVMKTPTWFDPKIKYPPFKGKLNLFKKIIG
jgi:aldehyde dehydrogenase (NAD+)